MKKLFVLVGCISLIHFSCHKNHDPDLITNKKPGLINPGSKKVSFKVTDVYSKLSAIKRRIDIINKKTNTVLGKMFITLSCNDPNDNLYKTINYEPDKFSGQITLESSNLIEFTKRILNGKLVKVENLTCKDVNAYSKPGLEPDPKLDPASDPQPDPGNSSDDFWSWIPMASCAQTYLDNMYWLDFALCAIKANNCLTQIFGICKTQ